MKNLFPSPYFFRIILIVLILIVCVSNSPLVSAQTTNQNLAILSASLSNGLVGYWNFDEGSGTTAQDSSGNNNTGILQNGPTWTIGQKGQALSFDKNDDAVRVGTPATLNNLSAFSVSAWLKPLSIGSGSSGRIVDKYTGWTIFMENASVPYNIRTDISFSTQNLTAR